MYLITLHNLMTCENFTPTGFMGGCSIAWLAAVVIVFVIMIARKQIQENLGYSFHLIGSIVGGFIPFLVIITIFGSPKWSLLAGILGALIGGLAAGTIWETE